MILRFPHWVHFLATKTPVIDSEVKRGVERQTESTLNSQNEKKINDACNKNVNFKSPIKSYIQNCVDSNNIFSINTNSFTSLLLVKSVSCLLSKLSDRPIYPAMASSVGFPSQELTNWLLNDGFNSAYRELISDSVVRVHSIFTMVFLCGSFRRPTPQKNVSSGGRWDSISRHRGCSV